MGDWSAPSDLLPEALPAAAQRQKYLHRQAGKQDSGEVWFLPGLLLPPECRAELLLQSIPGSGERGLAFRPPSQWVEEGDLRAAIVAASWPVPTLDRAAESHPEWALQGLRLGSVTVQQDFRR